MPTITTYLCNRRLVAALSRRMDPRGIEDGGDPITARILKPGYVPEEKIVAAHVISETTMASDISLFACLEDRMATKRLEWARRIVALSSGDFNGRENAITIEGNDPQMPCFWAMTRVYGIKGDPADRRVVITRYPATTGGQIPESKADVCQLSGRFESTSTQTLFVPGELLQLEWTLDIDGNIYVQVVAGRFFASPAFTGGSLVEIQGTGVDKSCIVDVQGEQREVIPTDLADYVVGDWVYVLKQGSGDAQDCDRRTEYNAGDVEMAEFSPDDMEKEIVSAVNRQRSRYAMDPLKNNRDLNAAAQRHAQDMADNEFLSNTGSDGSTVVQRVVEAGYMNNPAEDAWGADEAVARGYETADGLVEGLMDTSEGQSAILASAYSEIGVSMERSGESTPYFALVFGYRNEQGKAQDLLRMVPMTVNSEGNESAAFEKMQFDMLTADAFSAFFELSQHFAIIESIDRTAKTAAIQISDQDQELAGQVFSGVSFFYHCEDDSDTSRGHLAFRVDDKVLVINEGGSCTPTSSDLKVIGFREKIKMCISGVLVVSSPSGNESFAWDTINNEILLELDTHANILDQLGASAPAQLSPEGTQSRTGFNWNYYVSGGGSLTLITPQAGDEDEYRTVQHPDTLERVLEIQPLAFGENDASDFNANRKKWAHGDYVVLSTTSGSSSINVDAISSAEGTFDVSYCAVDASRAITQTWTVTVYQDPDGTSESLYIYIQGDTLGTGLDFYHKSLGTTQYPYTPSEHTGWLNSTGFNYSVERGNYILKDSIEYAPVVYHFIASSSSYVPAAKSKYETLTGTTVSGDVELHPRARLFYFPLFSWPFEQSTSLSYVPFAPWLPALVHETLDITEIFESWADCDHVDLLTTPTTDAELNVSTGIAEEGEHATVYDAYNLTHTGDEGVEHREGIHVFHKATAVASGVLATFEKEIFDAINAERETEGVAPLVFQLNMQWAARRHADDMASNNFVSHTGSDDSTHTERVVEAGYWKYHHYYLSGVRANGENIASKSGPEVTAQDFVDTWMGSQTTRDILLDSTFTETGVAIAVAEDGTIYACQVFGLCKYRPDGYSPIPDLEQYANDNFTWNGTGDEIRVPRVYLT